MYAFAGIKVWCDWQTSTQSFACCSQLGQIVLPTNRRMSGRRGSWYDKTADKCGIRPKSLSRRRSEDRLPSSENTRRWYERSGSQRRQHPRIEWRDIISEPSKRHSASLTSRIYRPRTPCGLTERLPVSHITKMGDCLLYVDASRLN